MRWTPTVSQEIFLINGASKSYPVMEVHWAITIGKRASMCLMVALLIFYTNGVKSDFLKTYGKFNYMN